MKRLKELRKSKDISQKEFAAYMNVAQNTVSRWENGERLMDTDTLLQAAEYFNVSADYLLGMSDLRDDPPPDKKEPIDNDELSDNKRALIAFAETVPEDKAEMILQVMKSIVGAD